MRRRAFLTAAVLTPLAARAQQLPPPAVPIAALNQGLLAIMHEGKAAPFAKRVSEIKPLVEQAFDLQQILQNSVGLRWASFSQQQKDDLFEAFTRWTIATWVSNFDTYDGETFNISPNPRTVGQDQVVQTQIVPRTGTPTRLDYVMRNMGSGWKAVDVLADGSISRVAVQRSDFRTLLRTGDPAPLIANLRYKADALAAGMRT
jgi:phospholipid transport system substrate-binding protein